MSTYSLLSSLDGLSGSPLKGVRSSWVGCLGSLLLVALCLWIYVPAAQSYFAGNFYQSMFTTNSNLTQPLFARDDFKLALTVRHKQTGALYAHEDLLTRFQANLYYDNLTSAYKEKLQLCDPAYFATDINGVLLEDCLMVPDFAEYDVMFAKGKFTSLALVLAPPPVVSPFPTSVFTLSQMQAQFADLLANYYCEFYFASKVVTAAGRTQFQLHRAYSTQINVGTEWVGGSFQLSAGLRTTRLDDSVMPWRNERALTTVSYSGHFRGTAALSVQAAATNGAQQTLQVLNSMQVAVRYYKKADWLLGVIGGGIFLLFVIFFPVFSFYNRNAARFELAEELLLQKVTNDYPKSEEELIAVRIPKFYMLRRVVPFCREEKYELLLEESERYNDIVLLLKKLKVARRNLKRKEMLPEHHDSKVIDLPELDRVNEEETSNFESSSKSEQYEQFQADDSHVNIQVGERPDSRERPVEIEGEEEEEEEEEEESGDVQNEDRNQARAARKAEKAQKSQRKEPVEREEGLEGSSKPPRQEKALPKQEEALEKKQDELMGFDQVEIIGLPQAGSARPQQMELPPESRDSMNPHPAPKQQAQESQPMGINPPVDANQLLLNAVPGQLIIIGTQEQLEDYHRNQQELPRLPSLRSDHALPPTTAHPARDDKFSLTAEQLTCLRTTNDPRLLEVLENNPTFQAMRENKCASFADLMELEEYDKWEGHYSLRLKKCLSRFGERVASLVRALDPFSVRVSLLDLSGSTTCCGLLLTMAIVALSILTFALTIVNMGQTQYIISENYLPTSAIAFKRSTDSNFNAVLCIATPGYFLGVTKSASLNFFTTIHGVTQNYAPVQMSASDTTLDLLNNVQFLPKALNLSNCFRMPTGVAVTIDGSGSHFGFTFTPSCSNTPAFCSANQNATYASFLNAVTKNPLQLFLPGSRLNPATNTLATDIYLSPYININPLAISKTTALEETVFANQVRLYDDSGNGFMRQAPPLKESNINVGYNTRRAYVKGAAAGEPSYTYRVKLNQAATDYTVTQKKADWILGIIGGVFVFWYAVVHLLARLYTRFIFNAYVAKLVYEEEGYEAALAKKALAMLRVPRWLLPRCLNIRRDTDRMRAVDEKIEDSLTHLGLLKYVDNCYRLSSAFFSSLPAKNFALLYFKEKIFEHEQISLREPTAQQANEEELADVEEWGEGREGNSNQVTNTFISFENLVEAGKEVFNQDELALEKLRVDHEGERDNIIAPAPSPLTNYFDLFQEPHSFSFRGLRVFSSVTGGLCCLLMLLLIILVVVFEVGLYLSNAGVTTSYDMAMDDGVNSTGITLTTGRNFKIGVSFVDTSTLQTVDPTPFFPMVGLSLLQQQFTRANGVVVPSISSTDLVPCPPGYIQSWVGSNIDSSYFSGLNNAYCAPDNLPLSIQGLPESQAFSSFKLSVYNKAGSAAGLANITALLNSTYVMLYFSSPRQNSLARTVDYEMESLLFAGLTALTPFETNITLSKSNVTYEDSREWEAEPLNLQTYRVEPYNSEWLGYSYYGTATSSLWFNISFSYTQKVHSYTISAPKFYEVFGVVGGVIAFFYCLLACCAVPFNAYKLRYEIGRQVYLFDKKRIVERKDKVKERLRKNTSDRKRTQLMNNLSEARLLEAFLLRPVGWLASNYNFNESLRCATLIQDRVSRDLDLPQLYLSLYAVRDALAKRLRAETAPLPSAAPPLRLTDLFFKKLANPHPHAFTIERLRNYAKQHELSSYEQMVVARAMAAGVRVQEVFDSQFLENVFNVVDDGRSLRLNLLNDTQHSLDSNIASSLNASAAEHSVEETGAEDH